MRAETLRGQTGAVWTISAVALRNDLAKLAVSSIPVFIPSRPMRRPREQLTHSHIFFGFTVPSAPQSKNNVHIPADSVADSVAEGRGVAGAVLTLLHTTSPSAVEALERIFSGPWLMFMLADGTPQGSSESVLPPAVSQSAFQLFDGGCGCDDECSAVLSLPLIGLGGFGREGGLSSPCRSPLEVADVLPAGGVA